jgi:transposase-like protein
MAYRRFTMEQKIRFLDLYEELGTTAGAARKAGVSREACRRWLKQKERLREDYERSLLPIEQHDEVRKFKKFSLEEKIKCINAVNIGTSMREAANQYDCDESSVRNWYKTQDALLALYYTQNDAHEVALNLNDLEPTPPEVGENEVPKDELNKDLSKKIKAQAKEIEYLQDKIAFLENLNNILKERTGPVKKKNNSQQSNDASNREEEM